MQGARQVGTSTLAGLVADGFGAAVVTLDDEAERLAAIDDPRPFLDSLGVPAVIDEIRRVGDPLVLAVEQRLDRSRRAGQCVLTGSTSFLSTPGISESLAGRIDLVTLWPLSMGEFHGGADAFVDRAFGGVEALLGHRGATLGRGDCLEMVVGGGCPEIQGFPPRHRRRWFERHLETVLRREVEPPPICDGSTPCSPWHGC